MDWSTLKEVIGTLFLVVFLCILPLLFIVSIIYSTVIKFKQRTAHEKLAQSLGFIPLNQTNDIKSTWYGGQYKGRNAAIRAFTSTYRYYFDDRHRTGFNVKLRIVVPVHVDQPLGVKVYRTKTRGIAKTFDEAFTVEGGFLSSAARDAMLAFSYLGHTTGLKKDLRARFTRGMREINLNDRDDLPKRWIAEEALPDAKVILTHDHPYTDLSSEELRTILDELGAVAQAIETDRVPHLLADHITPPKEGFGKYAQWTFYGILLIGTPACVCLFGILMTL